MSRATDFAAFQDLGLLGPGKRPTQLRDMTPVPLTAADTTLDSGVSRWVRNPGKAGGLHIELSDSTAATAQGVVSFGDTFDIQTPGGGYGVTTLNGFAWVRFRLTGISGAAANVAGTLCVGE